MAKRKREIADEVIPKATVKSRKEETASTPKQTSRDSLPTTKSKGKSAKFESTTGANKPLNISSPAVAQSDEATTIQIVTGSYERVLHGFTARIPGKPVPSANGPNKPQNNKKEQGNEDSDTVEFSDTFLFNAHASAIRTIAISPPSDSADQKNQKVILASGATDERINLFNLSTVPPRRGSSHPRTKLPSLSSNSVIENPKNRELGSLLHHSGTVTALYFPTKSKLLSAAEDNTIAISRTRDWTVLSTIKAPIPKPVGRPSGDTAGPGEVPAGINDFAVHPSMKLMVSVSKGERCMRLWNLVTGKKAGVLNFDRHILEQAGVSRFGLSEGQKVDWDSEGEEFVVSFERGAVVFGIDCKPRSLILPTPRTKIHQTKYLPSSLHQVVALSTEDGRVLFYNTSLTKPPPDNTPASSSSESKDPIPHSTLIAQLGGPAAGISTRVKDFEIITPSTESSHFYVITGSSDGTVRIWSVDSSSLVSNQTEKQDGEQKQEATAREGFTANQVGHLLGSYSHGLRIVCLKAFIMSGSPEEEEAEEEVPGGDAGESSESSEGED